MGQGQEQKTITEAQVEIQERGDIFFFYRPKVEKNEAHSIEDVQRLYIILRPECGERAVVEKQDSNSGKEGLNGYKGKGGQSPPPPRSSASEGGLGTQEVKIEEQSLFRLLVMGRKSLPDPSKRSRPYWGFVEMVTTNAEHVKTALKEVEYETSSRGHRHTAPARTLGEGVYRILRHKADSGGRSHTHLIYKLIFPAQGEKMEPQESLNIVREGSFIIQIKNPQGGGGAEQSHHNFRGLQNKRKAVFPAHLQGQLGHVKFGPADPPDFLNYEGCEFLLISASDDIQGELGLQLDDTPDQGQGEPDASCSHLLSTFGDISSTAVLLKGTWV